MNEMVEKICPVCGAAFVPRNSSQISYSDECALRRQMRQAREGSRPAAQDRVRGGGKWKAE